MENSRITAIVTIERLEILSKPLYGIMLKKLNE